MGNLKTLAQLLEKGESSLSSEEWQALQLLKGTLPAENHRIVKLIDEVKFILESLSGKFTLPEACAKLGIPVTAFRSLLVQELNDFVAGLDLLLGKRAVATRSVRSRETPIRESLISPKEELEKSELQKIGNLLANPALRQAAEKSIQIAESLRELEPEKVKAGKKESGLGENDTLEEELRALRKELSLLVATVKKSEGREGWASVSRSRCWSLDAARVALEIKQIAKVTGISV